MQPKHAMKRAISVLLCLSMILTQAPSALASPAEPETGYEAAEGTRLPKEDLPEESVVYFGTVSLSADEEDTVYRVPIFRDGNELPEEDITLHAMDISAVCGQDYELIGDITRSDSTGKTVLEMLIDGDESEEKEYEITVEGEDLSSYRSAEVSMTETDTVESAEAVSLEAEAEEADFAPTAVATAQDAEPAVVVIEEAVPIDDGADTLDIVYPVTENAEDEPAIAKTLKETESASDAEGSLKSRLAIMKEEQTGEPTRETQSAEQSQTLSEALWNQVVPELYLQLPWSCEQKIHFEEGQDAAELEFRIIDDAEAEGPETFSVTIVEAEKTRPYGQITLSVVISDDEAPEYSMLSFDRANYITRDGEAEITINRTQAVASLCTAVLKGTDTATGEETVYGEVVFSPYEESKDIALRISAETVLTLCDMTAAETDESSISRAVVYTEDGLGEEYDNCEFLNAGTDFSVSMLAASSGSDRSFNITFKDTGKTYKVEVKGDKNYGTIYDTRYTPAVEVGIYILPKSFSYGIYEGYDDPSSRNSEYRGAPQYAGFLHWYSRLLRRTGAACAELKSGGEELNGLYYQTVAPDWEQDKKDDNARCDFVVNGLKDKCRHGQFDRGVYDNSNECIRLETSSDLSFKLMARDTRDGRNPDVHLYFYGIACMYKCFRFTWDEPDKASFRSLEGTIQAAPLQFSIDYGVQTDSGFYRDVYANLDNEKTNLVVKTVANMVNGSTNIYGKIKGFKLSLNTVNSSGKTERKVLSYPEGYYAYLDSRMVKTDSTNFLISNIKKIINKRIADTKKKVRDNPDQIIYDSYFLGWMDSMNIVKTNADGKSYYQTIHISPVIEQLAVDVRVLLPQGAKSEADAKGRFASKELAVGTYNKGQFHAGDKLDMSCITVDDKLYETIGYQVSTDGGVKFNTFTSMEEGLLLEPNLSYMIRPVISERTNGIEIVFEDGAEDCLALEAAVIPQSELKNNPKLKGHTYLNLNPEAATVAEKIKVIPGKVYSVNVLVKKSTGDPETVYRPVFKDSLTKETYNGQSYSFAGRQNAADNVISIGVETVRKAQLKTTTLEGRAYTSIAAIRNDALGKHDNPALGYTAQVGNGQDSRKNQKTDLTVNYVKIVSGKVDDNGLFTIPDLNVKTGDRISVVFTNGDDTQVLPVVIQNTGSKQNIGVQKLEYPYAAPRVVSLEYCYSDPDNDKKTNLTDSTILMQDDQLKITACVNTKGKKVTKAVFRSVTVSGMVQEYTARADSSNPGIFEVTLPKLLENFKNGERLQVFLVAEEQIETSEEVAGTSEKVTQTITKEYPIVQTGFSFYTKSVIEAPKTFEASAIMEGVKEAVDMPLLGDVAGKIKTGKLELSHTVWPDKKGYTISFGMDSILSKNNPDLTNAEKQNAYNEYRQNVDKVVQGIKAEKRINTAVAQNNTMNREQRDSNHAAYKAGTAAKAEMNKDAFVTFGITIAMTMDYILNPTTGQYMLARTALTVGGRGSISKTFYTVFASLPFYVNLSGTGDASLILGGVYDKVENAMTNKEFAAYEGNINDILSPDQSDVIVQLDLSTKFKAAVGVGICGIAGARGYVGFGLQFQTGNNPALDEKWGVVISGDGGFAIDYLIGTFELDVIHLAKGYGSLKDQTKITMFNGLRGEDGILNSSALGAYGGDTDSTIGEYGETGSYGTAGTDGGLVFRELEAGEAPSGNFDPFVKPQLFGATLAPDSDTVLLTDASQYTRPQLLDLGDGRQFLSFTGASEDGKSVLYYTVRSTDGKWDDPERVYAKSIRDGEASLLHIDDKVYIAWQCADKEVGSEEALGSRLSAFELVLAIYDTKTGKMSEPEKLTDDDFLPIDPHLSSLGDEVYCSYTLVDYASSKELVDYMDFGLNYSTPAVTVIRDGKPVRYQLGSREYLERFVTIEHPTLTDPLVTDFQTETLKLTDTSGDLHELYVSAYTVDEDKDSTTETDKEIYLKVTERREDGNKAYYPIRLTHDELGDAYPELTKLGDELYLSWVSDTDTFCLMDIGELLSAFFAPETGSVDYDRSVVSCYAGASGQNWYKKTAAQLGVPETESLEEDGFFYELSIYPDLVKDVFPVVMKELEYEDGVSYGIGEHQLATDGRDIYIIYTGMSEEYEDTGVELYGFRYQRGNTNDEDTDETEELRKIGFSDPVQITDSGEVRDEISLFMTEDRRISLVSNMFTQKINETDGRMQYGDYKLVHSTFVTEGSVRIEEGSLELPSEMIPGQYSLIGLALENTGLYPAESFHLEIEAEKGGIITKILSEDFEGYLDSNEKMELAVPWEVPEDAAGTVITARVSENGADMQRTFEARATVEDKTNVTIYDIETGQGDFKEVSVTANILNVGNKAADGLTARLSCIYKGEDGNTREKVIQARPLTELLPGEENELKFLCDPKKEYFDEFGIIQFKLRIMDGDNEISSMMTQFSASEAMVLELNGGTTDIYIDKGDTMKISSRAYPWGETAGAVYYAAVDSAVAAVSEDGTVRGLREGTTLVSGYCPDCSLASYVYVHVGSGDDPVYSEETEDTTAEYNTIPSYVMSSGTWKQRADGSWTYLMGTVPVRNGWYCIYNPYADEKKKQRKYSWFYFGTDGIMKTGWLTDTDGNIYYLNPVSDNTKGAMVTGWNQINGIWYCFSDKEGSGTCGALISTMDEADR